MREALPPALALLAGAVLGALFFGGLWWTLRLTLPSARPAPWILLSLVVRTLVVLAGFYLLARFGLWLLATGLFGFLSARLMSTRLASAIRVKKRSLLRTRVGGA